MKTCKICSTSKPESEYYANGNTLMTKCKACFNSAKKVWHSRKCRGCELVLPRSAYDADLSRTCTACKKLYYAKQSKRMSDKHEVIRQSKRKKEDVFVDATFNERLCSEWIRKPIRRVV